MTTITVRLAVATTARTPVVGSGLDFENIREFLRTLRLFHGAIVEGPQVRGNWIVCSPWRVEPSLGEGGRIGRSHKIKIDGIGPWTMG